jgi:hemerythrin-like domain-containing protein
MLFTATCSHRVEGGMAHSKAIAALMHEHEIILKMVGALENMAAALREHRSVELAALREAVEFMRTFADKCHHAKEEDLLFPALVAAGLPETTGPVAVLKSEHARARVCIGNLAAAIDVYDSDEPSGRAQIIAAVGCITELYPQHIAKENNVLFPIAEQFLSAAALDALGTQFDEAEHSLGDHTHHHWAAAAERMASASVAPAA